MSPLSPTQVAELLDTCRELASEREQVTAVLSALPDSFAEVRAALNHLHRILN